MEVSPAASIHGMIGGAVLMFRQRGNVFARWGEFLLGDAFDGEAIAPRRPSGRGAHNGVHAGIFMTVGESAS